MAYIYVMNASKNGEITICKERGKGTKVNKMRIVYIHVFRWESVYCGTYNL